MFLAFFTDSTKETVCYVSARELFLTFQWFVGQSSEASSKQTNKDNKHYKNGQEQGLG